MRVSSRTLAMKTHLILSIAFAAVFAGCDQKQADVQELERKNTELQARLERL